MLSEISYFFTVMNTVEGEKTEEWNNNETGNRIFVIGVGKNDIRIWDRKK